MLLIYLTLVFYFTLPHTTNLAPYRLLDPFLRHHLGTYLSNLWKLLSENERPLHTIQHRHVYIESKEPTKEVRCCCDSRMIMVIWQPAVKKIQKITEGLQELRASCFILFSPRNAENMSSDWVLYLADLVWCAGNWLTGLSCNHGNEDGGDTAWKQDEHWGL